MFEFRMIIFLYFAWKMNQKQNRYKFFLYLYACYSLGCYFTFDSCENWIIKERKIVNCKNETVTTPYTLSSPFYIIQPCKYLQAYHSMKITYKKITWNLYAEKFSERTFGIGDHLLLLFCYFFMFFFSPSQNNQTKEIVYTPSKWREKAATNYSTEYSVTDHSRSSVFNALFP